MFLNDKRLPGRSTTTGGETQSLKIESEFWTHCKVNEKFPYTVRNPKPQKPEMQSMVFLLGLGDLFVDSKAEPRRPVDPEENDQDERHQVIWIRQVLADCRCVFSLFSTGISSACTWCLG
ncbi:hypothetical protein CEXT_334661 [Caerostris extrusa]|uniref:Uncharacterized protein n=1 Tax=Caerostris extrusa TaxID=172846 RepID=A0AAV4VWJ8_CAEEX|nr:hypothetical protein CEXT_334661 [Caerostris extrusa]